MGQNKSKWNDDLFVFDNLKFIAIFAICFYHGYFSGPLKYMSDAVIAFAVPIFAFTSGFGGKNLKDTHFFKKIVVLYFVGNLFYIPYYYLGSIKHFNDSPSVFFLILGPTTVLLWYILALLIWKLVTPFVMQLRYPLVLATIGSAILYWGAEALAADRETYGRHALFTIIRFALRVYPFYLLGVIATRDQLFALRRSKLKYGLIVPSLIALYFCGAGIIENNPKGDSVIQYVSYMLAATSCTFALISLVPGRSFFYVTAAGQRTLGIYVLHFWILRAIIALKRLPMMASLIDSSTVPVQIAGSIFVVCFTIYCSSQPVFITALTAITGKVENFFFSKAGALNKLGNV